MAKNTEQLRTAVRASGLRATPSRLAVLDLVRSSEVPMSHGDVAERLSSHDWDRATIYRNLIDLASAGLLHRTDVGDHVWRFEATSGDHDATAHPHFVCIECGSVECMPEVELATTRLGRRARAPRAVRQRQVEVHVRGLCDGCS